MDLTKKKRLLSIGIVIGLVCIACIFFKIHYMGRKVLPQKGNISNYAGDKVKYSNQFVDITGNGVLYIKKNSLRIVTIAPPDFTDINYSKNYEANNFSFSNAFQIKNGDRLSGYEKYLIWKQNLKNQTLGKNSRGNLSSPFFAINSGSEAVYRFMARYNFHALSKNDGAHFCIVKLNYYNDKGLINAESFRIYFTINDNKELLLDYFFIPPSGTTFMNIEILQPSIASYAFSIGNCEFFRYPGIKPHLYKYYFLDKKDKTTDSITQVFEFDNRHITRTIYSNSNSNKIDVNLKVEYKDTIQAINEYEPINVSSKNIKYIGRDMKLHNSIPNNNAYTVDAATPYFSCFNDDVLYSFNGYTSAETRRKDNNYKVKIYISNYNDEKYFTIGDGGVYKYTYTQKFNAHDESSLNYSLLINYKGPVFMPSRTPDGTHGTFIITNHPDSNTINILKAMMFGSSDPKSPLYMHAGFLYHKIPATWGFFSKTGGNLTGIDNPEFRQVINAMRQNGMEVVPHTITEIAPNNTRELLDEYMPQLQNMGINDWIDHSLGSGVHSAAIKSQGSIVGSSQFSMDLFKKYGFKYCWSYVDVPLKKGIDMLSDSKDSSDHQIFFKNNNLGYDDYSLYQWNTYRPKNFIQEISSSNLNELVQNDGISIIHDYFSHPMQNRKFFTINSDGNVNLTPEFERVLKLIDLYRKGKKLYVPTVRQFIEYSSSIRNLDIIYNHPGSITINNKNAADIQGFTLITIDSSNHKKYNVINLHPGSNNITLDAPLPDNEN